MSRETYSHLAPNPPLVNNKQRSVTYDLMVRDEARAEIMSVVRTAIYEHGDVESLSIRSGCSKRCIYAIRGGYTRWPRWETLFALLPLLGLELAVVPTKTKGQVVGVH